MYPVKLNHNQLVAENGFWKHMRPAFQDWLGVIMTKRYFDDFIRIPLERRRWDRDLSPSKTSFAP